jgi:hypothetical protein
LPGIYVINSVGDSIGNSSFLLVQGGEACWGNLTALTPNGSGGFIATGYLNLLQQAPDGTNFNIAHLSTHNIDENGNFGSYNTFNLIPNYSYDGTYYANTFAKGLGCFITNAGNFLAFGAEPHLTFNSSNNMYTHSFR